SGARRTATRPRPGPGERQGRARPRPRCAPGSAAATSTLSSPASDRRPCITAPARRRTPETCGRVRADARDACAALESFLRTLIHDARLVAVMDEARSEIAGGFVL